MAMVVMVGYSNGQCGMCGEGALLSTIPMYVDLTICHHLNHPKLQQVIFLCSTNTTEQSDSR
eukprot:scaffold6564_cov179-Skeletonema_marinoi.AAC.12